jgi:hypothetical protein
MAQTLQGLNIDVFKDKFKTGARSYLFYIVPSFPAGLTQNVQEDAKFLVRSSSLPSSNFDEMITSWQGFDFKTAGKRNYDQWTVSFTVDKDAKIRAAFANWMDLILDPLTNRHAYPDEYMVPVQTVTLIGLDLTDLMAYNLYYAWPSSVGEVSLDYANSDFAMFDVTYSYVYFKTLAANTPSQALRG